MGVAVKAIVNTRDEAAGDEEYDSHIVQLVSKSRHEMRVVRDGVIGRRHPQAERCPCEKAGKCENIALSDGLISRHNDSVQGYCQDH